MFLSSLSSLSSYLELAPYESAVTQDVQVEHFHISSLSVIISVIPNSVRICSHTLPCSVCKLCVLRLPINWGNYIYGRVILCGILLVETVFSGPSLT